MRILVTDIEKAADDVEQTFSNTDNAMGSPIAAGMEG